MPNRLDAEDFPTGPVTTSTRQLLRQRRDGILLGQTQGRMLRPRDPRQPSSNNSPHQESFFNYPYFRIDINRDEHPWSGCWQTRSRWSGLSMALIDPDRQILMLQTVVRGEVQGAQSAGLTRIDQSVSLSLMGTDSLPAVGFDVVVRSSHRHLARIALLCGCRVFEV